MGSGLTTSIVFGAALSLKLVEKMTRRQVFCFGHIMMGIFLGSAGYFYQKHNGIMTFGCLCGANVTL